MVLEIIFPYLIKTYILHQPAVILDIVILLQGFRIAIVITVTAEAVLNQKLATRTPTSPVVTVRRKGTTERLLTVQDIILLRRVLEER